MRTHTRFAPWAAAAAACVALAAPAFAQAPTASFDQIGTRVRVGDTVYVTDSEGRERKGTLHDLSSSLLVLRTRGNPEEFPADRVRSVAWQRPDLLRNGALIGMAIGFGLTEGFVLFWCREESCGSADYIVPALLCGGIGAGIGVGIDAIIPGKKVLVYERPLSGTRATLGLSPIVSPRRQGLAVSLAF